MLYMLPATTPKLAQFRRQLAVAFLLLDAESSPLPKDASLADVARTLLQALQDGPVFAITDDTNYPNLTALMSIADIAIGPGFAPESALLSEPLPQREAPNHASRFSREPKASANDPVTQAQLAHNTMIDRFSDALKAILSRINDRGATHMSRTDAKGVIERLIQRLELSVRCWPRKRGGRGAWMFDDLPQEQKVRTLDDFVRPVIRRSDDPGTDGGSNEANGEQVPKRVLPTEAAVTSFEEDEFEARAGV